jgi:hypothetical protein
MAVVAGRSTRSLGVGGKVLPNLILRRHGGWVDRWRNYRIFVDGREVAQIGQGERLALPVSLGTHSLQARIDWCRTKSVEFLVNNSDVIFDLRSGVRGWRIVISWLYLFMPRKWIVLEQADT